MQKRELAYHPKCNNFLKLQIPQNVTMLPSIFFFSVELVLEGQGHKQLMGLTVFLYTHFCSNSLPFHLNLLKMQQHFGLKSCGGNEKNMGFLLKSKFHV